jgi:hypothetical protein
MTDPKIHWCFKTTRPFEPGLVIGKGKHEQVACGLSPSDPVPNAVRGIHALGSVTCEACRNSLAFKQTKRRMQERAPNASIRGYQVVVTREVKDYKTARKLAQQAKRRGWVVSLSEVVREKPITRHHKLWSSSEGGSPPS